MGLWPIFYFRANLIEFGSAELHGMECGPVAQMNPKTQQLWQLIEPAVQALGCELWGIEDGVHSKSARLRIYIDRQPGGVTIEDCERVSRQVGALLDVSEMIDGQYHLEISSPGLDRPLYRLEQYHRFVGSRVKIRLRTLFEGRRNFDGRLTGIEGEDVVLMMGEHEYLLPLCAIEKAHIVPEFD